MSNTSSQPAADNPETKKLSFSTKLTYGAGDLGPAITANVLVFFLLYFFTNVAGLAAGTASNILLIGKVWDAINDPIVGVLSDRTSHRWGRRYPGSFTGQFLSASSSFCSGLFPAKIQRYYFGTMWRSPFCLTRPTPPSTCLTPPSPQN